MFANLNIYVVIRKYEPTNFYCCAVKFFQTKKLGLTLLTRGISPWGYLCFA